MTRPTTKRHWANARLSFSIQSAFGLCRRCIDAGLAAIVVVCLGAVPETSAGPGRSDWSFRVAPYIWIPAMTGDVTVKGIDSEIDTTISDIFTGSDFAFALQGQTEVWYQDRWGGFVNGQWAVLKQDDNLSKTPLAFDLKMNSGIFEIGGVYNMGAYALSGDLEGATWQIEPLAGARISTIKVDFDFDTGGTVDQSQTFVDPFFGARGTIRFGSDRRWSWTLRGDIGGFGVGSDFTWNAVGLLGYDFEIGTVPSSFLVGARALSQDYEDGSGADKFRWDVIQYGPVLALELRF